MRFESHAKTSLLCVDSSEQLWEGLGKGLTQPALAMPQ